MDESGYTAGAARKVAADKAMAASGKEVVFQFTETDQKVSQTGNVLARLSRQYVDGFASAQRFNAAINQLTRGVELGKIEMTQATVILDGIYKRYGLMADAAQIAQRGQLDLARAVEQANTRLAAQQKITPANQNGALGQRPANMNAGSFQTANIAAQFQDIGVTAAMGMAPLQIALQQGTQLSMVFEQMKASGQSAGSALATAFASVISPLSLITIGLVAGSAALIQYFMTAESASEKANKLLKEQNDIIRNAAKLWGDATPALKAYVDELDRADKLNQGREAGGVLATKILEEMSPKLDALRDKAVSAFSALRARPGSDDTVRALGYAWDDLRERVAAGTATVTDFDRARNTLDDAIAKFGLQALKDFSAGVDDVTSAFYRSFEAAQKARDEWIAATAGGSTVQDILAGSTFSEDGRTYQSDAFRPRGSTPVPERRPLYELDRDPDPATITNSDGVTVGVPVPERKPSPLAGDPDRKAESEAQRAANAYRDLIKTANDRVAQMRLEADVSGQAGIAAQALRFELDLLQKAQDKGREVTAQQREEIKGLAEDYRIAAEAAAKAKLQQDLMFEREQMFRSSADQAIAVRLRGAGLPVDLQSQEAQMMRENARIQETKDAVNSFFSDFKSALESNGGDIGEALGDALKNALINQLNNWADKAFEAVGNAITNALFGSGSAGSGGGSGVTGSLVGSIFGSRGSAAGATRMFNPANSNVSGAGSAVDLAGTLLGSTESTNASQINSFLKQGGVDIDAARTAWCAAFVNSSLQQIGVDGSGSLVANSFQNWGSQIDPSQVLRGDVLLKANGLSASQPGGHVGFATGATRMSNGQSQLEMLSGNYSGGVGKGWFNAVDLQVRRATEASDALASLTATSTGATQGLGQFGSGLGALGSNLASLFPAAPGGGVSGGGFGTWLGNLAGNLTNGAGTQWAAAVSGSLLPGLFADGTQSAPGGLAIVGERGRELVNLPRGSQVVPNHKTEHLLSSAANSNGGGSVKVDVEVFMKKDGTLDAHVRKISREESTSTVQQGLGEYRRNGVQDDIKRYNDDPYARGA
ncbi:phage tail length tape measure family protein [Rhizobium sp. TRM96647]|uniref:phage tail length tape measure family protein n=1 Tax=unclassified Rhizobium TaxID=2613769 RepID=UPI0021E7582B|nr:MULTISPECIES: phage tail length tape measure family protein [unclassified Rhizobium]MCV3738383.1 phage tail length tape measure family protein [Rhizobium sp. TRM96647]MCV3759868.1 phage tail length tape measure family protein [Rhizobium sp. TRM96650]